MVRVAIMLALLLMFGCFEGDKEPLIEEVSAGVYSITTYSDDMKKITQTLCGEKGGSYAKQDYRRYIVSCNK